MACFYFTLVTDDEDYKLNDQILHFCSDDICNTPREGFFMCPLCDERCDFWYLRDTCNAARALFLFDNGATVFFAAFMSLWGEWC